MIGAVLLLLLAGLSKAIMDRSSESNIVLGPADFWFKELSWRRKWKVDADGSLSYPQKERFPGSSTIFVFLTDGWHASQFVFLNSLIGGTVIACQNSKPMIAFLVASVVPRVSFEIIYRAIKR